MIFVRQKLLLMPGGTPSLSSKYAYHLIFRPWMPAHIH